MLKGIGVIAAAAALALAPLGAAEAAGVSKAQIARSLSEKGYSVQDFKSNMLAVSVGEHVVLVGVDGVDADVSYIAYLNDVRLGDGGHRFLSKFNSEVKFGRAYIDRDGDLALQMDRNSSGGVTVQNIESDFEVFLLLISKFLSDFQAQGSV
ncbi:MAG TPA: YbjN domain-containing protein [Parvularculaceae bacterium]|nr:YbjN domain-containing protein [Parvularculaceae bacterium]